jgi:hypothetical protein
MVHEGLDPQRHQALLHAMAPRPLSQSRGLQELVSYRSLGDDGDVSVYFRFPLYPPPATRPGPPPQPSRGTLQEDESP